VPAGMIRKRFSDTIIKQLLEIQWWHWTEEKMKKNREFFNLDLAEIPDADLSQYIKL
jgi:virginiamycin A acetyltransferase